ncbi:MAG: hypothetical protein NC453_28580 [Muribaculum sp.]|nr:hypothetical protein [Muribaculum sp.]
MNQEPIAEKLKTAMDGRAYQGSLTAYAAQSIGKGRSNYPVANLITYCQDSNLRMVMLDMATEDRFYPTSVLEVHRYICFLMNRYDVDYQLIYRKTAVHYTAPKSFDESELENVKHPAPLSIKTLLAVCDVIHCDLLFESK